MENSSDGALSYAMDKNADVKEGHLFIKMSLATEVKLFQLFCAPNVTAEVKAKLIFIQSSIFIIQETYFLMILNSEKYQPKNYLIK